MLQYQPVKSWGLFLYENTFKDFSPLLNLKPDDVYLLSFMPMDWRKKIICFPIKIWNRSHILPA